MDCILSCFCPGLPARQVDEPMQIKKKKPPKGLRCRISLSTPASFSLSPSLPLPTFSPPSPLVSLSPAVKIAEIVRKKKPKWYINDRRVRRLMMVNRLSLARYPSILPPVTIPPPQPPYLLLHLNSEKQAQEDETKEDFVLSPQDLARNPTEVFDLLEQRGKG